ncbi:MAG: peptide chain release factor N(5)-glutamine methyltransferase, partial [Nakamurella sp.]
PDGTVVEPEVAQFDPAEAVFGGTDGLAVIKPLISIAAGLLKVGGVLAIEHDDTQGETVPALLRLRRVLTDVVDHEDMTGRPRFVTATRVRLTAQLPAKETTS